MRTISKIILSVSFLISCNNEYISSDRAEELNSSNRIEVAETDHNTRFISDLLSNYFYLTNQFYAEKLPEINQTALKFQILLDSLPMDGLYPDSLTKSAAKTYQLGIAAEIKGLLGENTLIEKQRAFNLISDQLMSLLKLLPYYRESIYLFNCPTAFDREGGVWIQNSKLSRNPYLPRQVTDCVVIKDSLTWVRN